VTKPSLVNAGEGEDKKGGGHELGELDRNSSSSISLKVNHHIDTCGEKAFGGQGREPRLIVMGELGRFAGKVFVKQVEGHVVLVLVAVQQEVPEPHAVVPHHHL